MDETRIKGPGQYGTTRPAADTKAAFEVDSELPAFRQGLRVGANHEVWLGVAAVVYPAVSFPLLAILHEVLSLESAWLGSAAVSALVVAAAFVLRVTGARFSGLAVAGFAVWLAVVVLLQWTMIAEYWSV